MKAARIMAAVVMIGVSGLALHVAQSQQQGVKRTDLDMIYVSGSEVIQVVSTSPPGWRSPRTPSRRRVRLRHRGLLEYQIEGKPPVTLKAGAALLIPAETIHAAKNVGSGNAAELATYIVEKGKPLVVLVR